MIVTIIFFCNKVYHFDWYWWVMGWSHLIHWRTLVYTVINFLLLWKPGNFWATQVIVSFSGKTVLHAVSTKRDQCIYDFEASGNPDCRKWPKTTIFFIFHDGSWYKFEMFAGGADDYSIKYKDSRPALTSYSLLSIKDDKCYSSSSLYTIRNKTFMRRNKWYYS
jgi:hypothetical protein